MSSQLTTLTKGMGLFGSHPFRTYSRLTLEHATSNYLKIYFMVFYVIQYYLNCLLYLMFTCLIGYICL